MASFVIEGGHKLCGDVGSSPATQTMRSIIKGSEKVC